MRVRTENQNNTVLIRADLNFWLWLFYDDFETWDFELLAHLTQSIKTFSSIFFMNELIHSFENINNE